MKLLKVEHNRCDEYAASTYLWVPDEYAEVDEDGHQSKLHDAIEEAEKAYLADLEAYKVALATDAPPNPGYSFNVKDYSDNWTIREAKAAYEERKAAYQAHQQKVTLGNETFESYLLDAIPGSFSLWEGFDSSWNDREGPFPETLYFEQYWGHRHGTHIDYGETKFKDLKVSDGE